MTRLTTLLLSALLLLPLPAAAAPVELDLQSEYTITFFDTTPGGVVTFFFSSFPAGIPIYSDLTPFEDPIWAHLAIDGTSGPLVSVVEHRPGGLFDDYDEWTYGPGGAFSMVLTFELPDGTPHTTTLGGSLPGLFVTARDTSGRIAPVPPFPITLDSDSISLFNFSPIGLQLTEFFSYIDFNEEDFGESVREGRMYGLVMFEGADAVPEPALLVLLGLGLTAAARRYRNSRAR